jgi:hypothetical protein
MKNVLFIPLFILSFNILAQDTLVVAQDTLNITVKDTSWKTGGFMSLTFNQVSLFNWAAGGENALSSIAVANLFANYAKGKTNWDNNLDIGYGIVKQGDSPLWKKNEDKIDFSSRFGHQAKGKFYYSALINFRSQISPGYNYPNDSVVISRWMAPGYAIAALGMTYKPSDVFSVFVSPATGKFTFVLAPTLADMGAFGVDPAEYDETTGEKIKNGKSFRPEFGAYLQSRFQKDVVKNVNLLVKLDLFNNYTDKVVKNRQNIDVNWETMITMKLNKFMSASIFTHLIYDHDIDLPTYGFSGPNADKVVIGSGPKTQFKEVFGAGFSYKF